MTTYPLVAVSNPTLNQVNKIDEVSANGSTRDTCTCTCSRGLFETISEVREFNPDTKNCGCSCPCRPLLLAEPSSDIQNVQEKEVESRQKVQESTPDPKAVCTCTCTGLNCLCSCANTECTCSCKNSTCTCACKCSARELWYNTLQFQEEQYSLA